MLLLPQRSVPSSGGQMALQPLDQVHWPTEPDWLPEPALSRVRAWILGKAQPVAFVGGSLCVPDLSGKLSRASFKVACALQPCTVEKMGSRPTPAARLRLGPGGREAPSFSSALLGNESYTWKYNQEISNKVFCTLQFPIPNVVWTSPASL